MLHDGAEPSPSSPCHPGGASLSAACAVQGARHVGRDIAGKGIANPCAALFATAMLLRHINLPDFSNRCALHPRNCCPGAGSPCHQVPFKLACVLVLWA